MKKFIFLICVFSFAEEPKPSVSDTDKAALFEALSELRTSQLQMINAEKAFNEAQRRITELEGKCSCKMEQMPNGKFVVIPKPKVEAKK